MIDDYKIMPFLLLFVIFYQSKLQVTSMEE